jgi:hypothetical protein
MLIKEPYNLVIRKDKRTFIHDIKRIILYTIPSRSMLKSGFYFTGNNNSGISKIFNIKNTKRTEFTNTFITLDLAPTLPVNL